MARAAGTQGISRDADRASALPELGRPHGTGQYTVEAVAKAMQLLDAFCGGPGVLSLATLAEQTGIPRATVFRLLATLEECGYLTKSEDGYRPGLKLFLLGNVVASDLTLRKLALPQLAALRDATGETAQIAILEQWQVVYIERVQSLRPVAYMKSRVGAILPAYCTGLGKALLAWEDADAVDAWARAQHFERLTPTTITSAAELLAELTLIRSRGYALDDEEREIGVRCVAAPILTPQGRVVAAISVAAPSDRLPADLGGSDVARHVLQAASALSREMGLARDLAV
jgi:IclR family KDG regulon transcriptional repressor